MRLLNTKTLELSQPFMSRDVPDYMILSHRWRLEEVTFEIITRIPMSDEQSPARSLKGFSKVQSACKLAREEGYEWIWIDSCCIDKSSSAELQEAINSMWRYYAEANVCIVFMDDVRGPDALGSDEFTFRQSEWFQRGWTLQELLAPRHVEFYSKKWLPIGTKFQRSKDIEEATSIHRDALTTTRPMNSFLVAEKLSWASHRHVTREEDETYSLLGLFGISMPLLYGEGKQKAFLRLQCMIYNETVDHSLFLFRAPYLVGTGYPLLANRPAWFCQQDGCNCFDQTHRVSVGHPSRALSGPAPFRNLVRPGPNLVLGSLQSSITIIRPQDEVQAPIRLHLLPFQSVAGMLKYEECSCKIGHGKCEDYPPALADWVAVLNVGPKAYPNGAFCLILNQSSYKKEGLFTRASQHVGILPESGAAASIMPFDASKVVIDNAVSAIGADTPAITGTLSANRAFMENIALDSDIYRLERARQTQAGRINATMWLRCVPRASTGHLPGLIILISFMSGAWSITEIGCFEVTEVGLPVDTMAPLSHCVKLHQEQNDLCDRVTIRIPDSRIRFIVQLRWSPRDRAKKSFRKRSGVSYRVKIEKAPDVQSSVSSSQ